MSGKALLVCAGKDCRDDKGYRKLLELAAREPGSLMVPCQGLCHGPVAGVIAGKRVRWYSRICNKDARRLLRRAVRRDRTPRCLDELEVRGRRDEVRGFRRARVVRSAA